jgi:hypothetical protein
MIIRHRFTIAPICLLSTVASLSLGEGVPESIPDQNRAFDSVVETSDEGTSVLIIPMQGQMHTDINHTVFASVVDRIKTLDPDLIIIEIFSRDWRSDWIQMMGQGNPWYQDPDELNRHYVAKDLIDIVKVFNLQLKGIKQVAWVKDSAGPSTMLALSWSTLYMSPDARLQGTFQATRQAYSIKNVDTRGKILEFNQAHSEYLANAAERNTALLRAFIDPPEKLSGTWVGQKVRWQNDTDGDFIVDDGNGVPRLTATLATEVGISRAVTPTRNAVLLAEGIREYHTVGQDITDEILRQNVEWRSDYDKLLEAMSRAEIYMDLANGEQTAKYLRNQMNSYKKALRILNNSPGYTHPWIQPLGVALRSSRSQPGIDAKTLERWIEQIEERLQQLRDNDGGGRGGGGGGGRPGSGGGGR